MQATGQDKVIENLVHADAGLATMEEGVLSFKTETQARYNITNNFLLHVPSPLHVIVLISAHSRQEVDWVLIKLSHVSVQIVLQLVFSL